MNYDQIRKCKDVIVKALGEDKTNQFDRKTYGSLALYAHIRLSRLIDYSGYE